MLKWESETCVKCGYPDEGRSRRANRSEVREGYKRHSALTHVLETANWGIAEAYVLCEGNVEVDGPVTYLPAYMVMFL